MVAAAFALLACNKEKDTNVEPVQGNTIHFTATIAAPGGDATKTTYTEDGTSINVAWKVDDQIALVHNGVVDKATVTAVNTDGSATIEATITGTPSDNDDVYLAYPAEAVDSATPADGLHFTPSLTCFNKVKGQDGTLAFIQNNIDFRMGAGKLAVSGTDASLKGSVSIPSIICIWKLTLQDESSIPLAATKLSVNYGVYPQAVATSATGKSEYYLCVVPSFIPNATADLTIEATVGSDTYTYTKTGGAALVAGKYYQSTVTLSQQAILKVTLNDIANATPVTSFKSLSVSDGTTTYTATLPSESYGNVVSLSIPATAAGKNYTFIATDSADKQYWGYMIGAGAFEADKTYQTTVNLEIYNEKVYVDLGLSKKWANINETAASTIVATYDGTQWAFSDNTHSHDNWPQHSSATSGDFSDLINGTTQSWIVFPNDVAGYAFKSTNNHFIFLPAAGGYGGDDAGGLGRYWSGASGDGYYALLLFFSEGGDSYVSNSLVGNKFSVRLVCDAAAGGSSLVTGITLNKTATSIQVGSTETLSVTAVTPSDATDQTVTWSSSAESVATVTSAGVVTAVAAGTATITATANDGSKVSASCTVTVVPVGALSGKFSVSATKQVHFSKGNLQAKIGEIASYTATASEWRFAENQYRYIDSFAANDWVDLFSWVGTSATNDTYGLITFDSNSEEYHGNKTGDDGEILKTDWGTAAKANIGDNWYTLSKDEWSYLFNDRTGTCYCKAQVAGKSGVVLFPDNYSGTAPASPNTVNAAYTTNSWSAADWSSMETAGCVFLPAAGYRDGASVYNAGLDGGYWSSTPGEDDADYAYSLLFSVKYVNSGSDDYRYYGHSVRLVCDAPAEVVAE